MLKECCGVRRRRRRRHQSQFAVRCWTTTTLSMDTHLLGGWCSMELSTFGDVQGCWMGLMELGIEVAWM